MTFRGKRRKVVEVVSRDRWQGAYRLRCKLECGHTMPVQVKGRKTFTPSVGYCMDCAVLDVEAA